MKLTLINKLKIWWHLLRYKKIGHRKLLRGYVVEKNGIELRSLYGLDISCDACGYGKEEKRGGKE